MGKGRYSGVSGEIVVETDTQSHSQFPKLYSWEEVSKHRGKDSRWIVVDGMIYDVTRWQKRHPGGARILSHFAGQDASEVWYAMHNDKHYVSKFMKTLLVGRVKPSMSSQETANADFRELRKLAEDTGMFQVNPWFYVAHLSHIIILEILAYMIFQFYGAGWISYLIVTVILTTSQAQAGWTQHDYGHLSVFNSSKLNHLMHYFVIGQLKAASSHWWNFRHFQHHAKPNSLEKDPDIETAYLFLIGEDKPKEWGDNKWGFLPYQWQHGYFWLFGPPILLPVYFHLENLYFVFKRHDWVDLLWMMSFFARYFYLYSPILGVWSAFWMYMLVRFFESFWFTFVTQMNHIVMPVEDDKESDWLTAQVRSTCNVDSSFFNDWFTGHLNFQIEHHLFPTMPRHNYHKIAPLVQSLCKKHNLTYISKPLGTAFADILRSLKKSGGIWYDAYHQR